MTNYFYKYTGSKINQEKAYFLNLSQLFKTLNFTKKQRKSVYNGLSNREFLYIDYNLNKNIYQYKKNIWIDQTRYHKIERIYFYNGLVFG